MRKYIYIFKSEIMSSLQYVANIFINFIGYFTHILVFFNLWNYIYDDPSKLINGYSKVQMVWYVVITEILWSIIGGRKLCRRIVEDVKGGNIAYNLNKPYSYIGYVVSSHLGEVAIKMVVYSILGITLGFIFLNKFPNINFIQVILVMTSGMLATIINTLIITGIGLISFKMEDANPLYWLYSKIILILGTLFPIEVFPESIQGISKLSPIYVVSYAPAKLFVNFEYNMAMKIFLMQFIYIIIAYLFCLIIYREGVKKLNVNGG